MAVASWLADFKVMEFHVCLVIVVNEKIQEFLFNQLQGLSSKEIQDFSKKIVGDGHLKSELFKLLKTEKNPEVSDLFVQQ